MAHSKERPRRGLRAEAISRPNHKEEPDRDSLPRDYSATVGPGLFVASLARYADVSPEALERANSDHPSWHGTCPLCGQDKLGIDYKPGRYGGNRLLVACRECPGPVLNAICVKLGIAPWRVQEPDPAWDALVGKPFAGARPDPAPVPTPERVADYRLALLRSPAARNYLRGRGLNSRTIRAARLGYDAGMNAITIPIYDAAGTLVTVRWRLLKPAPGASKYLSMRGHPAQLYPSVPATGVLALCAGEFDAVLARQEGISGAFSGTAGIAWRTNGAWDWAIRGRKVAILYDVNEYADAQAQAANLVRRGAARAWAVDLREAGLSGKEDISDFFVKYRQNAEELRRLINRCGGAS